jgi:hypothetical protein
MLVLLILDNRLVPARNDDQDHGMKQHNMKQIIRAVHYKLGHSFHAS